MFVKLLTRISNGVWLGQEVDTGNPVYVNVRNKEDNYLNKVVEVSTQGWETWEIK